MAKHKALFGAGVLATSLLLSGVTGFAAEGEITPSERHELRHDRREIRRDHREIRGDRLERHRDGKEQGVGCSSLNRRSRRTGIAMARAH